MLTSPAEADSDKATGTDLMAESGSKVEGRERRMGME